MRWGRDCWFAKKIKDRDHLSYTDLVWLTVKQPAAYPKGFVWGDEQETWYKRWGFPGSMQEFTMDMERRKKAISGELKDGHGSFLHTITEKIAGFNANMMETLREKGFEF